MLEGASASPSSLSAETVISCELDAERGLLSEVIWLSGRLRPRPLCSGLGSCTLCRVRFVDSVPQASVRECELLSRDALASGWRLACQHRVEELVRELGEEDVILLELPPESACRERNTDPPVHRPHCDLPLGLALDLGTTSICYELVVLRGKERGRPVARASFINPQMGAGSDVVSRLAAAADDEKRLRLSTLVRKEMRCALGSEAFGDQLQRGCLSANTVMTYIFLNTPVHGLSSYPEHLTYLGDRTEHLEGFPPLYIPPLAGPFIGGDVICGILAVEERKPSYPWLLADLGTNAEFALCLSAGEMLFASVPMGPAMEGIGMRKGQLAGENVVTSFALSPLGLRGEGEKLSSEARGISATGYLSLLALLRRHGLMDGHGQLSGRSSLPLAQMILAHRFFEGGRWLLGLPGGLFLDALDVEEMLKVKAAWSAALSLLLQRAQLEMRQLSAIFLAGCLGDYVRAEDLEALHFLPYGTASKLVALGNTSLTGARTLVLNPEKAETLRRIMAKAEVLNLTKDPSFQDCFFASMHF